uniref:Wsv294-like protein n=1 Tax=Trachysalambria curvirostris nimavirus TaxID=2984282 RepID=A0A9C7C9A0_9VIRU|nr:MAG: wsv294-like protein [Trachysalambria curvirostris nimavirus]
MEDSVITLTQQDHPKVNADDSKVWSTLTDTVTSTVLDIVNKAGGLINSIGADEGQEETVVDDPSGREVQRPSGVRHRSQYDKNPNKDTEVNHVTDTPRGNFVEQLTTSTPDANLPASFTTTDATYLGSSSTDINNNNSKIGAREDTASDDGKHVTQSNREATDKEPEDSAHDDASKVADRVPTDKEPADFIPGIAHKAADKVATPEISDREDAASEDGKHVTQNDASKVADRVPTDKEPADFIPGIAHKAADKVATPEISDREDAASDDGKHVTQNDASEVADEVAPLVITGREGAASDDGNNNGQDMSGIYVNANMEVNGHKWNLVIDMRPIDQK